MRKTFKSLPFFLILILVVLVAFLFKRVEYFKNSVPFLTPGEKIPRVLFIDGHNQKVHVTVNSRKPVIIFIFERPCSTCTRNVVFWKKLNELAKGKADVFGIIQNVEDMMAISSTNRIPLTLLAPVEFEEFKKKWRVHLPLSQTYLLKRNSVVVSRFGDIGLPDVKAILRRIGEREGE